MKKFITSTVIVLTLLLLVTGCNKTKNLTDSEKFKEDYESLNKKDNGEVNYINVKINKENPDKNYLQIYKLRYDNGMTQKEIAEELNISQSEVSKRLFKLMEKIKQAFN